MTFKHHIFLALTFFVGLAAVAQNIEFIENKGQWDNRVRYMGRLTNGAFYIHKDGYTILQHNAEDLHKALDDAHRLGWDHQNVVRSHAYRVNFIGANPKAEVIPDKPLFTYNNYFIGSDPSKWASNCKIFQAVTIQNIYPNIDLRYYSDKGTLKYDIIVRPGGQVSDIALGYDGADRLKIQSKDLVISTSVGELKEFAPYTYQYTDKGKQTIAAKYTLKDNVLRFDIRGYDPATTMVIDPTLQFCSFSGSGAENWGFTATYGPDGSMFGGGIVAGSGFPVQPGAFQGSFAGGDWDIGIIKLTPDGTDRVYATYLGGSGTEQPHSLVCDPQGNLIIAGRSNSNSGNVKYPTTGTQTIGTGGSYDIVVTKLNATGTALIGSKMIGGSGDDGVNISTSRTGTQSLMRNYGDDGRSEVIIDGAGNIYVASSTKSTSGLQTPGGFQTINGGNQDGLVLKLSPDVSTLLFASYLGGSGNDAAYVLSLDAANNIFVAGGTESTNFPGTNAGVVGPSNHGPTNTPVDGYVAMISAGGALVRSTYIGTNGIDQVYGIQFDSKGFPYIMGQTTGSWQPQNAQWSQSNGKQFIAKLRPDLSAFVYSTMFGKGEPAPDISPVAFLVDRCENVYISGWGGNSNSGTGFQNAGVQGLPVTPNAIKSAPDINNASHTGDDFYFFVLKRDAVSQLYGSFFGHSDPNHYGDHVDGGTSRFDPEGVIYQAMCASCNSTQLFPTTPGAWARTKPQSAPCNLAMVKIAFNLAGVNGGVRSQIVGHARDTSGCVPLTVNFSDTVLAAVSYEWTFGDGTPQVKTTTPNLSHTFNSVGVFRVMLVAIDSTTCNVRDTSYINIRVGNIQANLDFNPVKLQPCTAFNYRFDNTSFAPPSRPFTSQSFIWNFGDNTPPVVAGSNSITHSFASPGTYNVKLILNDDGYCNSPDTITKQVRVAVLVKASFTTPSTGCAPYSAQSTNTSQGGSQFTYDFGDGNSSTQTSPVNVYTTPGVYNVRLIAIDSGTCNITDTARFTITVLGNPVANFSATPQPPQTNVPISFTNLSSVDAVRFKWKFGDGDSLITTSRDVVQHEYNKTGTYSACLVAINQAGCADTVCRSVTTIIEAAVDVPTAFTPLRGDGNGMVFVRGFGIAKMQFTIWNRWGQKVFESNTKNGGWDGKYKGQLLPMDVYAYTLQVEFTDGTKTTKTGDITLIR